MSVTKGIVKRDFFENKSILITGGAGFIGSHLAQSLLGLKSEATILDNLTTGSVENLSDCKTPPKIVIGDVTKPESFESIGEVDIIFHEAAHSLLHSFRDPFSNMATNVGGTLNVLEFARKRDAQLVFASSGSVYGNPCKVPISEDNPCEPVSPYGVSKLCGEQYLRMYSLAYGLDACSLRYFNVYGPRQRVGEESGVIPIFVENTMRAKPLKIHGSGLQTRDFVHVSDIVRANLLAATVSVFPKGLSLNIGGQGKEVSILELARLVGELMGKDIQVIHDLPKPGDISRLVADSSRANATIGYHAKVPLRVGLLKYINYSTSKLQHPMPITRE